MKLTDLEPQFLKIEEPNRSYKHVDTIAEADGIWFLCPKCYVANGNSNVGTHMVICWAPHVPQTEHPIPGRWNLVGSGYADLTLQAGSSSVLLMGEGCKAHFLVTNGEVTDA